MTGVYKCIAHNTAGSATCEAMVNVVGKANYLLSEIWKRLMYPCNTVASLSRWSHCLLVLMTCFHLFHLVGLRVILIIVHHSMPLFSKQLKTILCDRSLVVRSAASLMILKRCYINGHLQFQYYLLCTTLLKKV